MMPFCRKFKVWGVSVTLFFFVTVFIPGQAKANPLALIPAAAIGAGLAIAAAGAGSYYAPAVWNAGQTVASNVGTVGRQIYYGQKLFNSLAGEYFWGKASSLVANIGDFVDWLGSIADQIPSLWNLIQPNIVDGTPFDNPADLVGGTHIWLWTSGVSSMPCGAELTTPAKRTITGIVSTNYICASDSNPPSSISCLPAFVLAGTSYTSYTNVGSCLNGNLLQRTTYTVQTTTDDPTTYPPVFDPAGFREGFVDSPGVAADIDKIANNENAPPGLVKPVDTPNPAEAAGGVVTSPPAALTPADVNRGISAVRSEISRQAAESAQQIADENPTNPIAQQNAVEAQKEAAQDALEAENELPEYPNIAATSEPAYILPEVDFAERFQTFLSNIKSSSVFSVINNLELPIGTGESVLSFDFGSWGGSQSFDFADYSDVWLILRGVFFAVFCFISTRIVILKR